MSKHTRKNSRRQARRDKIVAAWAKTVAALELRARQQDAIEHPQKDDHSSDNTGS